MKISPGKAISTERCLRTMKRFFSMVSEDPAGCWVWQGHLDRNGYGQFWYDGKAHGAHRWAYAFFKRRLRDNDEVDHICRNHYCVNPEHLKRVDAEYNRKQGGRTSRCHGARRTGSEAGTIAAGGPEKSTGSLDLVPAVKCRAG